MTRFLGLDFTDLALSDAAEAIAERPAGAPFAYVVTPNADHLVRLRLGNRLVETGHVRGKVVVAARS